MRESARDGGTCIAKVQVFIHVLPPPPNPPPPPQVLLPLTCPLQITDAVASAPVSPCLYVSSSCIRPMYPH